MDRPFRFAGLGRAGQVVWLDSARLECKGPPEGGPCSLKGSQR